MATVVPKNAPPSAGWTSYNGKDFTISAAAGLNTCIKILPVGIKRIFYTYLIADSDNGIWFVPDYLLHFALQPTIISSDSYVANRIIGGVEWISNNAFLYYTAWLLTLASWSFGYIGPRPSVYRYHLATALARASFDISAIAWSLRYGGYYSSSLLLWFSGLLIAALLHLTGAYRRYRKLGWTRGLSLTNPLDSHFNNMTGLRMQYHSPEKRDENRQMAMKLVARNILDTGQEMRTPASKEKFWYHPWTSVEKQPESPMTLRSRNETWMGRLIPTYAHTRPESDNETQLPEESVNDVIGVQGRNRRETLFSCCYCCLDTDFRPPNTNRRVSTRRFTFLTKQRSLFLRRPPSEHKSIPTYLLDDFKENLPQDKIEYHQLCEKCTYVCNKSQILDLQSGLTIRNFCQYVWNAFRIDPVVEEAFEHWSSAVKLKAAVENNCHLCNLIWDTLSDEQQTELLKLDEELGHELEQALRVSETRDHQMIERLQRWRTVRIKIQSPWSQRNWIDGWKTRHAKWSLRLIPHFGQLQLPRRWLKQRRVDRAVSMDEDPVMDWDEEQVDPIEVSATILDNRGPILLPLGSSTRSNATMAFIKAWIAEHEHHNHDNNTFQDTDGDEFHDEILLPQQNSGYRAARSYSLPTRVIDVGNDDNSYDIRLVHKSTLEMRRSYSPQTVPYIALSHCWGGNTSLLLQGSNMTDLENGIPVAILPSTFRDAVHVTRKLGVRYLWIDSLCIIQDSPKDWQAEAARMHDVYSNALCVIAAVAAWNGTESFFVDQNPLAMAPCLMRVKGNLQGGLFGSSRNNFGAIYALPLRKYTSEADHDLRFSRLRSRAWIFQEEHLAKRVVYFGDKQVIVRCNICQETTRQVHYHTIQGSVIEPYPNMLQPDILGLFWTLLRETIVVNLRQLRPSNLVRRWHEVQDIGPIQHTPVDAKALSVQRSDTLDNLDGDYVSLQTEKWWAIVRLYSSRLLTKSSDKLIALSGIAMRTQYKLIEQGVDVDYIAGLWSGPYLVTGLLWYVSYSTTTRLDFYRAPSWSWASVDGTIENNSLSGNIENTSTGVNHIEILTTTNSDSQKIYSLCLRGSLREARWRRRSIKERRYYVGHVGYGVKTIQDKGDLASFVPHTRDFSSGPEAHALLACDGSEVGYFVPDTRDDVPEPMVESTSEALISEGQSNQLFCLRIAVQPQSRKDKEDFDVPWATRGIALMRADHGTEAYRRVGYFELIRTQGGITFPHSFRALSRERFYGRGRRAPPPNIDVMGFFEGCEERVVTII